MVAEVSPSIYERFEYVLARAKSNPHVPPKNKYELAFDNDFREEMFTTAADVWLDIFDYERVEGCLIDAQQMQATLEQRERLRRVRKYGLVMRSGHILLDERHSAPEPFYRFNKDLGKLIDVWFMEDKSPRYAARVLDTLHSLKDYHPKDTFNLASTTSFQSTANRLMIDTATKLNGTPLSAREFHDIRKNLRHIMNVLRISLVLQDNQDAFALYAFMVKLNSDLGEINGRLLASVHWDDAQHSTLAVYMPDDLIAQIDVVQDCLSLKDASTE